MSSIATTSALPLQPAETTGDADAPYLAFRRIKHFSSLDGLRCLSIFWVIGFHCQLTGIGHDIFRTGQYGVSLFFVTSPDTLPIEMPTV